MSELVGRWNITYFNANTHIMEVLGEIVWRWYIDSFRLLLAYRVLSLLFGCTDQVQQWSPCLLLIYNKFMVNRMVNCWKSILTFRCDRRYSTHANLSLWGDSGSEDKESSPNRLSGDQNQFDWVLASKAGNFFDEGHVEINLPILYKARKALSVQRERRCIALLVREWMFQWQGMYEL